MMSHISIVPHAYINTVDSKHSEKLKIYGYTS